MDSKDAPDFMANAQSSSAHGASRTATMPNDLCVVCGSRSNTYSFGVFCCRACCAFFRRSLNKKYSCRRENNCKIDQEGLRNSCRSCRLTRCYQAGMSAEKNDTANLNTNKAGIPVPIPTSATAIITGPSSSFAGFNGQSSSVPVSIDYSYMSPLNGMSTVYSPVGGSPYGFQNGEPDPSRFPFIHKVLTDFQTLQRSQKSLYSIENPHTIFTDTEFHPISKTLFKRMENGTMSLIHNLLSETLDYYGHVENKLKIEVAKQVAQKYAALHRCFLTAKHFPDTADKRIATHYGYYIDPANFGEFFENKDATYTPEQKARLIVPVLDISWRTSNKFRELKMRELEVAALASVFIWNQLEDLELMTPEMCAKRDATHREFHVNVMAKYGVEVGASRLVRIMALIQDVMTLNTAYQEMLLMASLFNPDPDCSLTTTFAPASSFPARC